MARRKNERRARPPDRGEALLQLHAHLRAGAISETTFRVGVEHLALADDDGTHRRSRTELAAGCSSPRQTIHDTQIRRANKALIEIGFMTSERRLVDGAYRASKYTILPPPVPTPCANPLRRWIDRLMGGSRTAADQGVPTPGYDAIGDGVGLSPETYDAPS